MNQGTLDDTSTSAEVNIAVVDMARSMNKYAIGLFIVFILMGISMTVWGVSAIGVFSSAKMGLLMLFVLGVGFLLGAYYLFRIIKSIETLSKSRSLESVRMLLKGFKSLFRLGAIIVLACLVLLIVANVIDIFAHFDPN